MAASAGASLAAGIGSVMMDKADEMATSFQSGVDQTIGGKVAAAIRHPTESQPGPVFSGDAFAAPQTEADEIAAFVNREPRA